MCRSVLFFSSMRGSPLEHPSKAVSERAGSLFGKLLGRSVILLYLLIPLDIYCLLLLVTKSLEDVYVCTSSEKYFATAEPEPEANGFFCGRPYPSGDTCRRWLVAARRRRDCCWKL